jgi:uncharacterized protein YecT (DUF1311 family)
LRPAALYFALTETICGAQAESLGGIEMKSLVVAILMTVISCLCFAQDSAEYRACSDKANTQSEMTACASDEAARVDVKLNTTYRALLARVASQPEALAKIKAAQRAWIAYRDAYIDATYPAKDKAAEYGSMYALDVALLRAKLTQRQIAAVEDMLQRYTPKRNALSPRGPFWNSTRPVWNRSTVCRPFLSLGLPGRSSAKALLAGTALQRQTDVNSAYA